MSEVWRAIRIIACGAAAIWLILLAVSRIGPFGGKR